MRVFPSRLHASGATWVRIRVLVIVAQTSQEWTFPDLHLYEVARGE